MAEMTGAKWLQLPSSIMLATFAYATLATGKPAPTSSGNITQKPTSTIASTGSGPEYASACWQASMDYDEASSSWMSAHAWVSTTTQLIGGTSFSDVTYYENATTLCDGHARVTYSPAVSLSTGTLTFPGTVNSTSTIVGTYYSNFPQSAPTCTIAPSDCDGLWKAYSTSLSAVGHQTTSPPLETPPCLGRAAASSYSSAVSDIYGCGECTIYGEGVELVYFPTYPSTRDMCASTPTATLTSYGPGAVITAYAGKSYSGNGDASGRVTAVADGHTFTSGTAYISISTVYAVDRCSKTFGTPVKDAILAMPSESVLSLRYSQDHFQRLMSTDQVTGYPVSYADFNTPIPWSAWNGQNICDPGGYGGWACSIVYEHSFRPQLAIPPEITQLAPEFKNCQMWYNGLWDPPLALTEAASEAKPTQKTSDPAAPTSAPAAPTSAPTALSNELPTHSDGSSREEPSLPANGPTLPASRPSSADQPTATGDEPTLPANGPTLTTPHPTACVPANEPWERSFRVKDHTYWATGAHNECRIGAVTVTSGGPTQTLEDGTRCTYGNDGLILKGYTTVVFEDSSPEATDTATSPQVTGSPHVPDDIPADAAQGPETVTITVNGDQATAVQSSDGGPIVIDGTITLAVGAPATTFADGEVVSAATGGLVVEWTSTVGKEQETGSLSGSSDTGDSSVGAHRTSSGEGSANTGSASGMSSGSANAGRASGMPSGSANAGRASETSSGSANSGSASGMPSAGTGDDSSSSGPATRTSSASTASSNDAASSTGSASTMSSAQALSLFAAMFAMVIVGG